ncbi:MAG: hypothetical protein WAT79_15070 [Saprospiraceae bacterium]
MKNSKKFDLVKFRKELRKLKDENKFQLNTKEYLILVNKIIPKVRQNPEHIHNILNPKDYIHYRKLNGIIVKIKDLYNSCLEETESVIIYGTDENPINPYIDIINPDFIKYDAIESYINSSLINLSVRSQKCVINILEEIKVNPEELFKYENISYLLKLPNIGLKSANEIHLLFSKLISCLINLKDYPIENHEHLNIEIKNSEIFRFEIIEYFVKLKSLNLPIRGITYLNTILKEIQLNHEQLFRYADKKNISKLKNIRSKMVNDLHSIFKDVVIDLQELISKQPTEISRILKVIEIQKLKTQLDLSDDFNKINTVNENKSIDIDYFKMLDEYLQKNIDFRSLKITEKYLTGYDITLQDVGDRYNLSRQRIMEIVKRSKEKLKKSYRKFEEIIINSGIHIEKPWEKFPNVSLKIFFQNANLNFPNLYYEIIFGNNSFPEFSMQSNENVHLKDLFLYIDEEIRKPDNSFTIDPSELISRFLINKYDVNKIEIIKEEIVEYIIIKYGIKTTAKGELLFEQNVRQTESKKIIEIFQKEGKPIHLKTLSELTNKSIESLRSILINNKNLFILTGRSTYGLKKWEDDGKYRGGTILQLIFNYLSIQPTPKNLSEITIEIQKYRETNEKRISGLLQSDKLKRFNFYTNNCYGVAGIHGKRYKISEIDSDPFII